MRFRDLFTLGLLPLLMLGVVACSDDDDDNPVTPGDTSGELLVDATSYSDWTNVNLATGDVVSDDSWHVSFRRSEVRTNGGATNENGTVMAVDLEAFGHEHGTDFDAVTEVPAELTAEDWQEDTASLPFMGWYDYDFMTHTVSPSGQVFAVRDNTGSGYAKIEVTDVAAAGMGLLGSVSVKYVHNPSGDDLTGTATTLDLTADGSGMIYFSFADGQVSAGDTWDLFFNNFDVHVNGGTSGDGDVAVYAGYDDPELDDFDALAVAPTDIGASYETDAMSSVLTDWYEYMGPPTHELRSWGHVYLITDGSATFKFHILTYNNPADGESGWYTVEYEEL